jgi:hypothetical protein
MPLEGLIGEYGSAVEGNVQIIVFSNFRNYFIYF